MRYSFEPKYTNYVQGYSFLSFARKFGNKYGKKLMDTATKTEKDASKTASKRVVHQTAEATGDLIGNKIADKITLVGKSKNKEKKMKQMKCKVVYNGGIWHATGSGFFKFLTTLKLLKNH